MDISHGASWNKVAQQQQQQQQQQQHISNDSSLGGDEFYDAMEDMSSRPQRISGISSGYGSNRSARTRSSSASNLVPTAEAAELMKLVASTNSSVKLDVSAFATPAEYAEAGASSGGYWLGGGGADGSHGENRSNNPFSEDAAAAAAAAAETRRRWPLSGHQQPAKLVVDDISSAENTPSTTPVHTPSGGGGIGGGGISASTLPAPPQPPPRPGKASGSSSNNTSATTLNPFAKESHSPKGRQGPTSTNPFVTASSTLNPFADDCPPQQEQGSEGGGSRSTGQPHDEGEGEAPPRAGELAAAATAAGDEGGGSSSAVKPAATAAPSADCNNQKKPPPLPPRRAASPSPAHQQGPPSAAPRSRTTTAGGEGSSGPTSPRSTVSSTTCDSGGGGGQLEGSGGGLDAGSVGSSAGSDGTADRKARKKYMVVNKDTGQKFDVRELDNHLPADNYALLPSRNDLIELERRRSATSTGSGPATPTPTTPATTLGKGKGSSAVAARSGSPSPRSALPTAVAASMPAAVGSTSSRREKAKTLGSMVRRKLGKVKTAAGAAAAAATAASPSSPSRPSSSGLGGGDTAVGEGGEGGGGGGGGSGDRGSIGGMGAAAKAAREALAGIRVSLKGKEASETLAGLMLFQELRCHDGPIWTAAFNQSGQFLATAGQDARILLHRVGDVRGDLEEDGGGGAGGEGANGGGAAAAAPQSPGAGPNRSGNNSGPASAGKVPNSGDTDEGKGSSATTTPEDGAAADGGGERPVSVSGGGAGEDGSAGVGSGGVGRDSGRRAAATVMIDPNPWQIWEAHKGDVVALSWSRNDFLLSASLDKSVRLWHTTQRNCLHCFHHAETVTSVDFHPLLEHFFLSGCFDKKIRVWNIRDGRVQEWQQAPDLVTAAKFSLDGQMIVAGLYMGQVLFYQTEGMRYFTQIECRNRRGTKKRGCKVSGFAFKRTHYGGKDAVGGDLGREGGGGVNGRSAASSPGGGRLSESPVTPVFGDSMARAGAGGVGGGGGGAGSHIPEQLLVTTNDSRLRLYNTDDFGMNAKYKGFTNDTLQITATFSEDGKQIICGSENGKVYVWNTGVFATASPSTLPVSGSVAQQQAAAAAAAGAGGANPAAPPAVAPTQKDTNQRHESFHATSEAPKIVTTACFVPESTSRACVTAVRGGLSRAVAESGGYCGCMILATDYNGSVRVYCKSAVLLS